MICPGNETFVFTCRGSQVFSLSWSVQPDYEIFTSKDVIKYTSRDDVTGVKDKRPPFTGLLVDVFNKSNTTSNHPVADLVSTLTVSTEGILNGTMITCTTLQKHTFLQLRSSIAFIRAGIYISSFFFLQNAC